MKKLLTVTAISVAVMVMLALPVAYGQDRAPQGEKVFEGQLTRVDTAAKSITVKGTGDLEMKFTYTEQTQVLGQEKTVQGLAGKVGTELRVTYRDAAGNHTATKIEMIEKEMAKFENPPMPRSSSCA